MAAAHEGPGCVPVREVLATLATFCPAATLSCCYLVLLLACQTVFSAQPAATHMPAACGARLVCCSRRRIRLGEFGDLRFPYPLDRHAPGLQPDAAFQRLAAVVKRHHDAAASTARRPRVVIARRQRTRILANADALQARLAAAGLHASVVDFGAMSFDAQVCRLTRWLLPPFFQTYAMFYCKADT